MKKLRITLACVLAVLIILTGCTNKGTLGQSSSVGDASGSNYQSGESTIVDERIDLVPIAEVRETFETEAEKVKAQSFDNMSFADAYFSFPEVDEAHILEYALTDFDISPDDAYAYMCKRLDELFPGMFSDEEKATAIRFYDVIYDPVTEEAPTFEQYKAMGEIDHPHPLTDHPTTVIDHNKDCYLYTTNGILGCYDDAFLAKRCDWYDKLPDGFPEGFERRLGMFDILEAFPVIYRTENLESERVFHLESGDISIAEAVASAEKQLGELELSERELPFKLRVTNVNVMDIGDGCCAFYFGIVPEYKGIKCNTILPDECAHGFQLISDTTHETEMCGEALMYKKDNISRYRQNNPAFVYDVTERGTETSIIPLKDAAEIASEYMTAGMNFKVLSVSAVYKEFSEKDFHQYDDDESFQKRQKTVRPCWRFVLQPLSGNTDLLYFVFVDMLTGECYSTVQQMNTRLRYDQSTEM